MTRQSDNETGQMIREAELWRRIRALDAHVLGRPGERRRPLLRLLPELGVLLVTGAVLWLWPGAGHDDAGDIAGPVAVPKANTEGADR